MQQKEQFWTRDELITALHFNEWVRSLVSDDALETDAAWGVTPDSAHDIMCPLLGDQFPHEAFERDPQSFVAGVVAMIKFTDMVRELEAAITRYRESNEGGDDIAFFQDLYGERWQHALEEMLRFREEENGG